MFKHELTHHIQEIAPVEYQTLKEFVMQEYYKGDRKAFQAAIDEAEIAKIIKQDRTLGQTILDAIRNLIESTESEC